MLPDLHVAAHTLQDTASSNPFPPAGLPELPVVNPKYHADLFEEWYGKADWYKFLGFLLVYSVDGAQVSEIVCDPRF